ncbi:MAG: hypothetical protein ABR598_07745 [Candidatus Dormibacteria bacterium]
MNSKNGNNHLSNTNQKEIGMTHVHEQPKVEPLVAEAIELEGNILQAVLHPDAGVRLNIYMEARGIAAPYRLRIILEPTELGG